MKEMNLSLNINEVNSILRALSTMPYNQVNTLIEKVQQQAQAQIGQTNGVSHDAQKELKNN